MYLLRNNSSLKSEYVAQGNGGMVESPKDYENVGYGFGVLPINKEKRELYNFSFPKGFIVSFEPNKMTNGSKGFSTETDRLRIFRSTETHYVKGDPFSVLESLVNQKS